MEHGIILLKPDGVMNQMERIIFSRCMEYKLEIICFKRMRVNKGDVKKYIRTSFDLDEYSDYMSSGPLSVFLVYGEYTIYKLIKIKRAIRKMHGVTCDDMKNYVHSTDCGNEFFWQLKFFFPELAVQKFSLYADMCVRMPACSEKKALKEAISESSVSHIAVIADAHAGSLFIDDFSEILNWTDRSMIRGIRFACLFKEHLLPIIGYFPSDISLQINFENYSLESIINCIHKLRGLAILDYFPECLEAPESILQSLKLVGLDGAIVYDARYTQHEVAKLEYIVADFLNLLLLGGSNGVVPVGALGIDQSTFDAFQKRLI